MEILQAFMIFAAKEHDAAINKQNWYQLLWSIKENKPDDTVLWTSARTYNTKTLRSVVLKRADHDRLVKDLDTFLTGETRYKALGVAWTRGYLLHGPPGCGKTSLVKAISEHAHMNIFNLNLSEVESDSHLQRLFRQIPRKAVVLIEDIDCMSDVVHRRKSLAIAKQENP